MKKKLISVIILITAFVQVPLAFAEDISAPESNVKKKVIYKKRESHKFGGISLKGQLKKPDLDYIYKRKGLRQEKIVNIPEDFNDEIIQGAGQF
ncbi:MAG: hypothetical protein KDD51_04190 [Bdellovibrionales bacterium]|nr:hypothetical protein [Bdellovibrionales bacterium]